MLNKQWNIETLIFIPFFATRDLCNSQDAINNVYFHILDSCFASQPYPISLRPFVLSFLHGYANYVSLVPIYFPSFCFSDSLSDLNTYIFTETTHDSMGLS